MSRICWDLDVQANSERLCEYLRAERPMLQVGLPKCKAIMDLHHGSTSSEVLQDPGDRIEPSEVVDGNIALVKRKRPVAFCMQIRITAGVTAPRRCHT